MKVSMYVDFDIHKTYYFIFLVRGQIVSPCYLYDRLSKYFHECFDDLDFHIF